MILKREVRADEFLLCACAEKVDGTGGEEAAVVEEGIGLEEETHTDYLVGPFHREPFADGHVERLGRWKVNVIAWRALKHGHMSSAAVAHGRQDGHSSGT